MVRITGPRVPAPAYACVDVLLCSLPETAPKDGDSSRRFQQRALGRYKWPLEDAVCKTLQMTMARGA